MTDHSCWVSTPQPTSDRACARLARMSTSRRTASIPSDRFIFSKTGSPSSSNRPCQSLILIHHQARPDGGGQAEKIDEAFGIMVVVTARIKRSDVLPVQAEWRPAALHGHRAFVKAHCHGAGHDFLRFGEERIECFSQRSKPMALIHHLRIGDAEDIFVVAGLTIQDERLQLA